MECYLVLKVNEVLIHVITWRDLENLFCKKKSGHKRVHNFYSPVPKSIVTRSRFVCSKCEGKRN